MAVAFYCLGLDLFGLCLTRLICIAPTPFRLSQRRKENRENLRLFPLCGDAVGGVNGAFWMERQARDGPSVPREHAGGLGRGCGYTDIGLNKAPGYSHATLEYTAMVELAC